MKEALAFTIVLQCACFRRFPLLEPKCFFCARNQFLDTGFWNLRQMLLAVLAGLIDSDSHDTCAADLRSREARGRAVTAISRELSFRDNLPHPRLTVAWVGALILHPCSSRSRNFTRSFSSPSKRDKSANKTHIYLPASLTMATPAL